MDIRSLPAPEPVPDQAAYAANRERALAADPRRRQNYARFLQSARRGASPDYLPIKLDIENVSRCNLRCTMCVVGEWANGRRAGDMPLEAFQRLIDEQYGLIEIKLQGIGEPTMQGDPFFAMIRYARARHIWVRTTTNATLLHLRDNYRKLIDSDVNEVQISIDGADKATYESIRRGGRFEHVARNCAAINAYCVDKGVIRTKMWSVVQRGNIHQLHDLVRFAADHGFRRQVFSLQLSDWAIDRWQARNAGASAEDQLDPKNLMELVALGDSLGVSVRFWTVAGKYSTERPETLCPWPFERAYVSSDLKVVPCCYIGNPEVSSLGALDEGFSAVWHGASMRDFRAAHLNGCPPEVCRRCYAPGHER